VGIITIFHAIPSIDKEGEKACTGLMWLRIMANDGFEEGNEPLCCIKIYITIDGLKSC
jgi:hypothetical protein